LSLSENTSAQVSIHEEHFIFFGALPHSEIGVFTNHPKTGERLKYYVFGIDPKVGYFVTDKIAFGASLRWNILRSNFTSRRPALGPGIFGRYYFGFFNKKLNSLTGTTTILGQEQPVQMSFYGELGYSLTNEALTEENFYHVTDKITNHLIAPGIGYNFSFIKYLYLNASLRGMIFFPKQAANDDQVTFPRPPYDVEIGLFYYFPEKSSSPHSPPQIVPMTKHAARAVAKLFQKTDTFHSNDLVIGAAGTFFPSKGGGVPPEVNDSASYFMHEGTLTLNVGYDINKFFRTGLKSMTIFTKSSYSGRRNFWRGGPYLQFDFLGKKRGRLFLETGVYYGNYCTCGDYEPYRKKGKGLTRLAIGGGGSIPLGQNLYVDLSILSFPVLGKLENNGKVFADGKYNIGLSYSFDL